MPPGLDQPTAIIAWLDDAGLACLSENWSVHTAPPGLSFFAFARLAERLPESLAKVCARALCHLVDPYDPTAQARDLRRFTPWARSRGLVVSHPRIQLQAYFAATLLGDAIMHVRRHLVREYVIETIEHGAYRSFSTAGLPRVSLAQGQRFASKGAYVIPFQRGGQADWVVP